MLDIRRMTIGKWTSELYNTHIYEVYIHPYMYIETLGVHLQTSYQYVYR